MVYYVIKIDRREYTVQLNNTEIKIGTEIGWLSAESFIEYLIRNEKQNALIDLATIGLDRILNK